MAHGRFTARIPDGVALLDELRHTLTEHVYLPTAHAADAVTLWIAATHAQPAWTHAPRLVIRSTEHGCGKTRLLEVIETTCHQPMRNTSTSTAAMYAALGHTPPTLLVDDVQFLLNPAGSIGGDLRRLLTTAYTRTTEPPGGGLVGDVATLRIHRSPAYAMAAIAGIGVLHDTVTAEAIVIGLRRAPSDGELGYLGRFGMAAMQALAGDLTDWLRADIHHLANAQPRMPVTDRPADVWTPLLAVADHAGEHWPTLARNALLAL